MIVNSHSPITLDEKSSIHVIELFTETLCDQLFINETYFGNILMTLSDLFNVLNQQLSSKPCKLSYNTDFLTLNILIEGAVQEILDRISLPVDLSDLVNDSNTESLFLIQTLSDDLVIIEDNVLKISFDISAIHNKIYQDRIKYLRQFFEKTNGIKVKSSNGNN